LSSEKFSQIDGMKVRYIEDGTGECILLLHGGGSGSSAENWSCNIPFLSKYFRVIAVDLPGWGKSDEPKEYSGRYSVSFVLDFLNHIGVRRCSVIGSSRGSGVAAKLAIDHPEIFNRLVICSGGLSTSQEAWNPARKNKQLNYLEKQSFEEMKDLIADTFFDRNKIPNQLVWSWYEFSKKHADSHRARHKYSTEHPDHGISNDLAKELGNLKVPTLLIWGRQDKSDAFEVGLKWQELTGAELHAFEKCGHMSYIERAPQVNELLLYFLKRPKVSEAQESATLLQT
jgi:pimeloyl-ACP methyl ester carboxylesterase